MSKFNRRKFINALPVLIPGAALWSHGQERTGRSAALNPLYRVLFTYPEGWEIRLAGSGTESQSFFFAEGRCEGRIQGKTAIYKCERPAIFAAYLIRINRKKKELNPIYLNYFLNSQIAKKHGSKVKCFGVNQSNINGTKLKQYPFPICEIANQREIVKEIETRLFVCEKIEEAIENSLQLAEALRLSIIKKAFEGKLVPQNPGDEPAEKLLDRIKALRQAQVKKLKEEPEKKEKAKTSKMKLLVNG